MKEGRSAGRSYFAKAKKHLSYFAKATKDIPYLAIAFMSLSYFAKATKDIQSAIFFKKRRFEWRRRESNLSSPATGADLRGCDPLVTHFGFSNSGFSLLYLIQYCVPEIFKIYLDYDPLIRHIVATYKQMVTFCLEPK